MKYRREIDGLRAVAVLPVIFFHAGFTLFAGGFVGVDVFFVISGFLITRIILADLEADKFSLLTFYDRRARRILPALFFVILCCLPFAWWWLLPVHLEEFSRSLAAVAVFSSNFHFLSESGYFATAAELKPLLHTWSLAVEEQYYLVFPLMLLVLWRQRKSWVPGVILAIAAGSLLLAQWGTGRMPTETFYLLPTRAWELAVGALVAACEIDRKDRFRSLRAHRLLRELPGLGGLVLVGIAIFGFDKSTPFPGFLALVPTIGTALAIVFATPDTLSGRLLSTRPLVGLGLISYSTYLWHQPVFVFARHRFAEDPGVWVKLLLALLSVGLAWLSWRFVEMPFRNRQGFSRGVVFGLATAGSVAFASLGAAGFLTRGFDGRVNARGVPLAGISTQLDINHGLGPECDYAFTLSPRCRTSDEPEILVWGDSFAMHLIDGFMASKPDVKLIQMTKSVCGPILGTSPVVNKYPRDWPEKCVEFNNQVLDWLDQHRSVKYVVMSSIFKQYLGYDDGNIVIDGQEQAGNSGVALERLSATLARISEMGMVPVLFAPPPRNGQNLGQCLANEEQFDGNLDACNFPADHQAEDYVATTDFLRSISRSYKVVFIEDATCADHTCVSHDADVFLYRDNGHLSKSGSALLGRKMNFYELVAGRVAVAQELPDRQ